MLLCRFCSFAFAAVLIVAVTSGCGLYDAFLGLDGGDPGPETDAGPDGDCAPGEHDDGTGGCAPDDTCASGFDLAMEGGFCVRIERLADMPGDPRSLHSATLIGEERVVVIGGFYPGAGNAEDAQILDYNIADDEWTQRGFLERYGHQTYIDQDELVIVGGATAIDTTSAVTNVSVPADSPEDATIQDVLPALVEAREGHTLSVLRDGRIVVIGGGLATQSGTEAIEVLSAGQWSTLAAGLDWAPAYHAATLLEDDRILVTGGNATVNESGVVSSRAAIVDVNAGTVTAVEDLEDPRAEHTATLLPNGDVLIVGGRDTSELPIASTELFDGSVFRLHRPNALRQARMTHSTTSFPNGDLLVTGGTMDNGLSYFPSSTITLIDANGDAFDLGVVAVGRSAHPAVKLDGRRVLLVGGSGPDPFDDAPTSSVYLVTVGR